MIKDSIKEDKIIFDTDKLPLTVGTSSLAPDVSMPILGLRWHDEIEIKYVLEGDITVTIEEDDYAVKKGETIIINPFESHKTKAGKNGATYLMLICSPKFFLKKFNNNDFYDVCVPYINGQKKFPNLVNNKKVSETLLKIDENKDLKYSYIAQEGLINYLFAVLFSETVFKSVEIEQAILFREKSKIEPAIAYIKDHLGEDLDIVKLSELCSVNKFYFSRLFKSALKVTPHEYITKFREEKAEKELLCSNKKISEIANDVGFNDEFYFSRWFKKRHGISPNEYRAKKSK